MRLIGDTVDRLVETNPDFDSFVKSAVADIKGLQTHISEYDEILSNSKLEKYIEDHDLKTNY